MEPTFEEHVQERAVLVGLNADCFKKDQTATEETLEELEALLETAGGFCTLRGADGSYAADHCFWRLDGAQRNQKPQNDQS